MIVVIVGIVFFMIGMWIGHNVIEHGKKKHECDCGGEYKFETNLCANNGRGCVGYYRYVCDKCGKYKDVEV